MSNATGGTFRAVVSDTDFSVAVGIFVAIAVVSFLPLIAVIIRLAVSKAVQPMSKSMSASSIVPRARRRDATISRNFAVSECEDRVPL